VEKNKSKYTIFGIALVIKLFIIVRLWHLTDSCLWFDEIFSVHAATNDWNNFLNFIAQDLIHPPLFYFLLKFWLLIGGESLLWTRLFTVFFSVLSIVPFMLLCRELKLTKIQILIGLFAFAVNGSLIKYAQEVRMYSPLVFLSIVSIWLFVRWLNNANVRFIGLLFVNLLLIYTHYFGWLVVISELFIVVLMRQRIKQFLTQFLVLIVAFLPWVILVFNAWQLNQGLTQNIGWQVRPSLWQFFSTLHQPFYFPTSNLESTAILLSLPLLFICLGLIASELLQDRSNKTLKLLAAFFLVPIILAFVASFVLPVSVWGIRHLTVIFVPYFLLVAISLSNFKWKSIAISVLSFFTLISGFTEFTRPKATYIWCAWENVASKIESDAKIYTFEDLVAYHLWFANRSFEVTKINGYEDMPEDKAYFLPRGFEAVKSGDKTSFNGDSFYIAFRDGKQIPSKQVLEDLRLKGYKIEEFGKFEAQGLVAFIYHVSQRKLQ
jgi:uncharacterized membrane protein